MPQNKMPRCRAGWFIAVFVAAFVASDSQESWAHQPVLDRDGLRTRAEPFVIDEPEISKAIFSVLADAPHYYRIDSPTPFRFYAGITQPKLDGCALQRTFSFEVLDANFATIETRDGETAEWWAWFEEYGENWYWVGPEVGSEFLSDREYAAGTYYIHVYNRGNEGPYVLAVGDQERFTLPVIVRTLFVMPQINRQFWQTSACQAHDAPARQSPADPGGP